MSAKPSSACDPPPADRTLSRCPAEMLGEQLEQGSRPARAFLHSVLNHLPVMMFVKDAETRRYLFVNKVGERIFGRTSAEVAGMTDEQLFPDYAQGFAERDAQAIASGTSQVYESTFVVADGSEVKLRTTRILTDGLQDGKRYIVGISEDVTAERRMEAEALRLTHYDPLTGLMNRTSFIERLYRLVERKAPFAMIAVDLDRFMALNDQFGHSEGDEVLWQVGRRLHALLGRMDSIARVDGDEFVVLVTGEDARSRSAALAAAMQEQLAQPFKTKRIEAHVGASIGIVVYPDDGQSTGELREHADLALYRAKQSGRGMVCTFDEAMDSAIRDRRGVEADLREAVQAGEISVDFQPVFSTKSGQITSFEALARWHHPERGPISPGCFIAIAEEAGLIDELGRQLLLKACTAALQWPEHVRVGVNLSPLQFQSGCLVETVQTILMETGLAPGRLQLEVTEGLVIQDPEKTFAQLERMRASGIHVLIDDFGVGYSSLSYFQRFRFDKVKLDKSFVDEIETSEEARAIVEAVVGLGKRLGMGIVAEGVETEDQMRVLVELGCTHLQGFLFSRPLPEALVPQIMNTSLFSPPNETREDGKASTA